MCELICVTSRLLCRDDFCKRTAEIAESRADKIILREKQLSEKEYKRLAKEVLLKCGENSDKIVLHNYFNAAKALGCKSIHLPFPVFEGFCDFSLFESVGTSVHSTQQAVFAEKHGAGCIVAGHIFETDCKKGLKARGTQLLEEICKSVNIPVYAIGGINTQTVRQLKSIRHKNFKGICVMSEFMTSQNVKALADTLKKELKDFE